MRLFADATGRRRWPRVAGCILANTLSTLPVFLIGALAPFFENGLSLTPTRIGIAIAAFFLASSVASAPAGRWVDTVGGPIALVSSNITTFMACGFLAAFATNWLHFVAAFFIAGTANALVQPAANLVLVGSVPARQRGFTLALKQSATPAGALLTGALTPIVVATAGWRAVLVLAPAILLPWSLATMQGASQHNTGHPSPKPHSRYDPKADNIWTISIAALLGAAAASSLGPFLVDALVAEGTSTTAANRLLSIGGLAAIVVRLTSGAVADRYEVPGFRLATALTGAGAFGFLALGMRTGGIVLVAGAVLAFGAGWGWPGVYQLGVVTENLDSIAASTGSSQVGIYAGGVVGPAIFGLVADAFSYRSAWLFTALLSGGAAVCFWRLTRRVGRELRDG